MMVFGGDRSKPDHPTHACPGAPLAKGVLLGLLSAILEVGTLTPKLSLVTVGVGVTLPPEGQSEKPPHKSEMAAEPNHDTAAAAASCQDIPIESNPVLARSSNLGLKPPAIAGGLLRLMQQRDRLLARRSARDRRLHRQRQIILGCSMSPILRQRRERPVGHRYTD